MLSERRAPEDVQQRGGPHAPASRAAPVQSVLATLPRQLVTYEELQAFFIAFGCLEARIKEGDKGAPLADIMTAFRLAVELLSQLAPDNPSLRYAASMASFPSYLEVSMQAAFHASTMLTAALDVARQQGSDIYSAACGYQLATDINMWVVESAVRQGLPPPSVVLGWLQQAEAAHRRCKALLPKQWTIQLESKKALTAPAKAYLQQMQRKGIAGSLSRLLCSRSWRQRSRILVMPTRIPSRS